MSQYKEINVMKLKEKRQHDGEKMKCLDCKSVFNSDCSLKHNSANHEEFLKSSKNIPFVKYLALQKIHLNLEKKPRRTNDYTKNSFSTEQVNIFYKI